MDKDLETKFLSNIDKNLDILLAHYANLKEEQHKAFISLRRDNLKKKSSAYLADHSFYNYKQTDKKLKLLSGMKQLNAEIKKVKHVK